MIFGSSGAPKVVERWGMFQLVLEAVESAAATAPVAQFEQNGRFFTSRAFPIGPRRWVLRFMPDEEGVWTYALTSPTGHLASACGSFRCEDGTSKRHGPVTVANRTRFAYRDGERYLPFTTTLVGWHLADVRRRDKTLAALRGSPFNRVRMAVDPPPVSPGQVRRGGPFLLDRLGRPDFGRIDLAYFEQLEDEVTELMALGMEVELVLFAPGHGDGASEPMPYEAADSYVSTLVSRFAAYPAISWCLSAESPVVRGDPPETCRETQDRAGPQTDWRPLLRTVAEWDYGHHLLSVEAGPDFDFGDPLLSHVTLSCLEPRVISRLVSEYQKPVILGNCGFEGDLAEPTSSLTGEALVAAIWEGTIRGGYVNHGEAYSGGDGSTWSGSGGELRGQSVPRVAFLRRVLESAPADLQYSKNYVHASTLESPGRYYLQYCEKHQFPHRTFVLPEGVYEAQVLDTWNMTIETIEEPFEGNVTINLPVRPYQAIQLRRLT